MSDSIFVVTRDIYCNNLTVIVRIIIKSNSVVNSTLVICHKISWFPGNRSLEPSTQIVKCFILRRNFYDEDSYSYQRLWKERRMKTTILDIYTDILL